MIYAWKLWKVRINKIKAAKPFYYKVCGEKIKFGQWLNVALSHSLLSPLAKVGAPNTASKI